jgi:signal transduction histidine kinase
MLRALRWRLTLAFMLVILLFISVVGVGGYLVLQRNYTRNIDLSLQHRMALQFRFYGFALPAELQQAEIEWGEQIRATAAPLIVSGGGEEGEEHEDGEAHEAEELLEGAYSSDLALIFIFPLDATGALLADPNPFSAPIPPNTEASAAALENGSDWRTIMAESGERVRLLSYRLPTANGLAVLQMGRSLADQDQALGQLVLGVSALGGLLILFAGISSWWLAGRSLGPAQRAWDQQQAFIANASHELRTPLTLIRASAEMALRGKLGKKENRLLEDVIRESDYMSRLVDDLLLLSRLDSGRLSLEVETISVPSLVEDIRRQTAKMAGDHELVPPAGVPDIQMQADPTRLRQILLILLDNAIKHTPAGTKIWFEAEAGDSALLFRVRDDGPGIGPEHLPHIFDRFYQADAEPEGESRSNGLGLSIAKGLTELHGGGIQVHSGPGTSFEVRIPRK